jgi:hypothetical protein
MFAKDRLASVLLIVFAIGFALTMFPSVRSVQGAPLDPNVDPAPDSKSVAEVDAGQGPCTADFIVNDEAGKPVYAAKIRVRVSYGFRNLHKLDLNVGTNAEGKARFIGLPENSKTGGLFFRAYDGEGPTYREASAFDNPEKTCKAQFTVVLRKKPQED